jgi:hypothetical protein
MIKIAKHITSKGSIALRAGEESSRQDGFAASALGVMFVHKTILRK